MHNKRIVDYHIHTKFSDGVGNHEQYIKHALEKGIDEIGFSEHLCLKDVDWAMSRSEINPMIETISHLQDKYQLEIKTGIEMDYFSNLGDKIKETRDEYPFDYVIGSVHFIDGWNFDNSDYIAGYRDRDIYGLYLKYFALIQKAASSKLFDIIAHPDVIKKYGFRPKKDITSLLQRTAQVFRNSEVCIEVNTNGLRKPCKEIYPNRKFLEILFENGVPVTLGSDAHEPQAVGQYFDRAIKMIADVGYKKIAQFTKRKRKYIEI